MSTDPSRWKPNKTWPNDVDVLLHHPLLAAMLTISGATLGNASSLETTLLPNRVNGALHCALVGDSAQCEDLADRLTDFLRREQDDRLVALGNSRTKDIRSQIKEIEQEREAFFGGSVVRDRTAVASFEDRIRTLQRLLHPALIVENPQAGGLEKAAARCGGSLLAVYGESFIADLKRARCDIEILVRSWQGKTPQTRLLDENAAALVVRPVIGGLFCLSQPTLARLACSLDPVVQRFFDRLIIVPVTGTELVLPDYWKEIISRCLTAPRLQGSLALALSAQTRLATFKAETEQSICEEGRLRRQAPLLAAKVSRVLHVWVGDLAAEIGGETMERAVARTKKFVQESVNTANRCVASSAQLEEGEEQLLTKLRVHGPMSAHLLQRKYKKISMQELERVIGKLMAKGKVHRREDGVLEPVQQAAGGALG
jgi:hypothetical protein